MKAINFSKIFSGYGHYKLIVEVDGSTYTTITSNMFLVDRLNSEEDDVALEAKIEAIELVLRDHSIDTELKHEFSNRYQTEVFYFED